MMAQLGDLVNIKTGKFRYFATVEGAKGKIPMPFLAFMGAVSGNVFDAIEEKDPLPDSDDKA